MPPGPARSSQPWSTRPWWSPAPTPPQRCCPTWPGSSSPHALSGPMSPPRPVTLAGTRPYVPGPDHTCLGSGVPAATDRPSWPRAWPRTSGHRSPAGLLRRARSRHTPLRLIDPWQGASPTAATRGSSAPCSPPPSPPCAPTPSPGPTTSANATKANRLGPGRPRPGPPPHPDPARHDPQQHPLQPPTSHETTHRRLTHHIGAPPRRKEEGQTRHRSRDRQGLRAGAEPAGLVLSSA